MSFVLGVNVISGESSNVDISYRYMLPSGVKGDILSFVSLVPLSSWGSSGSGLDSASYPLSPLCSFVSECTTEEFTDFTADDGAELSDDFSEGESEEDSDFTAEDAGVSFSSF